MTFIKVFDRGLADALSVGGFSYITENLSNGQQLYVFEETVEVKDAIDALKRENFSETVIIRDDLLNFSGGC